MKRIIAAIAIALSLFPALGMPPIARAATADPSFSLGSSGSIIDSIGNSAGLSGADDLPTIIGRVIGVVLGILGVVFLVLVGGVLLLSSVVELYFSYRETRNALVRLEREKAVGAAAKIEQFVKAMVKEFRRQVRLDPTREVKRELLKMVLTVNETRPETCHALRRHVGSMTVQPDVTACRTPPRH